jgi:hypothetical protein
MASISAQSNSLTFASNTCVDHRNAACLVRLGFKMLAWNKHSSLFRIRSYCKIGKIVYPCQVFWSSLIFWAGNPYWRGGLSTVDLLVLTSSEKLLFILNLYFFLFYETSYLNKEVNRTEPCPSVRVPWCWGWNFFSMPLILQTNKQLCVSMICLFSLV